MQVEEYSHIERLQENIKKKLYTGAMTEDFPKEGVFKRKVSDKTCEEENP